MDNRGSAVAELTLGLQLANHRGNYGRHTPLQPLTDRDQVGVLAFSVHVKDREHGPSRANYRHLGQSLGCGLHLLQDNGTTNQSVQ